MGIVRDLFYAKKMSAGLKLPAPSSALLLKRQFLAGLMGGEKTFTGSVVSFTGRATSEITALTAAITPVQSGSGDPSPSNVRPITGRTGANVYVSPTENVADATTYAVDWTSEAGTVYGGTLDVVSGVLTVNMAFVDLGSLNWTLSAAGANIFTVALSDRKYSADIKAMCSMYPFKGTISQSSDAPSKGDKTCCFYYQLGQPYRNFYVYDTAYSDVASFKTAMNGVQLCYELKTPVTYQLTPQTVTALLGQNYVWADTGDVTVTVKGAGVA